MESRRFSTCSDAQYTILQKLCDFLERTLRDGSDVIPCCSSDAAELPMQLYGLPVGLKNAYITSTGLCTMVHSVDRNLGVLETRRIGAQRRSRLAMQASRVRDSTSSNGSRHTFTSLHTSDGLSTAFHEHRGSLKSCALRATVSCTIFEQGVVALAPDGPTNANDRCFNNTDQIGSLALTVSARGGVMSPRSRGR